MDSKTYDEIRNLTLLFFLDRLIDKGQPRTLHDLSCQFGTKGFTKEMRQIAGGSQSGLRKFFSKYPSLFTIDGEYISITCYNSGGKQSLANKNDTDITESGVGRTGGTGIGGRDYAIEAVEYFCEKLEQYGEAEVPIRSLLGHRSQAIPEVRHISGQHIKEFKDFLSKYPDSFVVREEYVVLRKHWDAISDRGGVLEKREPSPVDGDCFAPVEIDPQITTEIINICRTIISNNSGSALSIDSVYDQLRQEYNNRGHSSILTVKNSRDLAVLLKMHSDSFLVQSGLVSLVATKHFTRQVSNNTQNGDSNSARNSNNGIVTRQNPPTNQSFKQRLVSHLIKAIADNNAMEQRVYQSSTAPAAGYHPAGPPSFAPNNNSANLSIGFDVDVMNARLLKSAKIITKLRDCQNLVTHLKSTGTNIISMDAEGVNLGPNGPMTLLQIGTGSGNIFILDLVACREMLTDGGIKEILESPNIVKVVHDCRNDSAALYYQFDITLNNVFDTQAAHAVILKTSTNKPVHKVKNISLNNLCRTYGASFINPKKEQMKKLYRRDQRFWSRRPLTDDMILYAAYDIFALVPSIYETMNAIIEDRSLFNQLCWEQVYCYLKTEEVKLSKKQRKNESEVEELKKKLAQASGKSVVLSNREIRLLRHVNLTEEEKEKLECSYKVAQKLERIQNRLNANATPSGSRSNADSSEASPEFDEDEDFELDDGRDELEQLSANGSRASSPSFEESIRMVEEFLVNDRYERLQGLLQDETLAGLDDMCHCSCHPNSDSASSAKTKTTAEVACQTMSTGDIVITKVHFEDKQTVTSSN